MSTHNHPPQANDSETRLSDDGWGYTADAAEVARLRQELEKNNGREVRHTISRDGRIDGGVYEGNYGGEAIVVDRKKYSEGYDMAMASVEAAITRPDGSIDKSLVMQSVFNQVRQTMKYDQYEVGKILQDLGQGKDGTKIALQEYIQKGVGVCRHQALFAGQLLEGLKDKGYISGSASIDRNKNRRVDEDGYDGHAWVRYTNGAGEVFIIDVAHGIIGSLDQINAAREKGARVWDYERPEDKARRVAADVALTATLQNKSEMKPTLAEFDENGLLKMPDFIKRAQQSGVEADEARNGSQVRAEKTQADRIHEQSASIDGMLEELSADDKSRLFRYRMYLDDKKDAQSRGDGQASAMAGQYAGQELRSMSAKARAISSNYVDSVRHLDWLRESQS